MQASFICGRVDRQILCNLKRNRPETGKKNPLKYPLSHPTFRLDLNPNKRGWYPVLRHHHWIPAQTRAAVTSEESGRRAAYVPCPDINPSRCVLQPFGVSLPFPVFPALFPAR